MVRAVEWQGWFTLGVLALVIIGMVREIAGPDLVMMAGLLGLAAVGVLSPQDTFSGFANPVVPTVGALFILGAAMRETGAMEMVVSRLFGPAGGERSGLTRLCPPLAAMSAFLNNATLVAMSTPVVIDWARRHRLSPSRFLLPISYATILGGTLTLMGTSTILTVAGLILDSDMEPMGFFELAPVGLPICAVGLAYLLLVAPRALPERKEPSATVGERLREYTGAMIVEPDSALVGQSVEGAGLRRLAGLFLVEIDRAGRIITPVGPDETLEAGDRLVFAGVVDTILDLQRFRGLVPASDADTASPTHADRRLVEAVISHSSPLVNQSVRDANFRTVYDAAVIAVHRNGERVAGKIGAIVLRPGDTLLLQTGPGFLRAHGNSADFYLASEVHGGQRPRFERLWVSVGILIAMVASVAAGVASISIAALLAAGAFVVTGCLSGPEARRSVQWQVLVVIGAGLGIALAMQQTGAAGAIARVLVEAAGPLGPVATLAVVYGVTLLMAEFLQHNAAAAIMFPVAAASATELGVEPRGFVMAVAIAASCSFAVPVSYQTHLIVYGPGGYRFTDFVRLGLPLDLLCAAVALLVIPMRWPL